ncbi:MAG TPA: adenylyl-sulfate kinase, partial [Polyangiaceae bacterium]|nr:adenylyl-sulfate kinase [Polyangiaceae bacterium]
AAAISAGGQERAAQQKDLPSSRVNAHERAERLGQKGAAIWLTGLPASGKSEIAYELERQLFDRRNYALVIDPDDGLGRSAPPDGSSPVQAPELARRASDAGLLAVFAYATPLRADRAAIREAVGDARFVEVHVATSLEASRKRDLRGAYSANKDPKYEAPLKPDVRVELTGDGSAVDAAASIIAHLIERGLLPSRYSL